MPYDSTGVYTPPAGAETAAPGDVIRSSTWNSIFTDISAALTLLGQQLYGTTSVTGATYVPVATDSLLLVNRAGAVAINLPTAATMNGAPLAVKDISGVAHTNNITITPNGAERIEGLATVVINVDYGGYWLYPISGGWILRP